MNAETKTQDNDRHGFTELEIAFGADMAREVSAQHAPSPGGLLVETSNGIITARKCDVQRDLGKVLATIKILARAAGQSYYYRWKTRNKDGTQGEVSGPTIKLANDVARVYGNCQVDVRTFDNGSSFVFYARFVDVESGYSLTRAFQQRKSQKTTKKDDDRDLDIAFQIGQSKAIRNVICNALQTLVDFAFEEAEKSAVEKFAKDLPFYRGKASEKLEFMGVLARAEKAIGRKVDDWTAQDLAKLQGMVQAVDDGMATIDDVFPQLQAQGAEGQPPAPPPVKQQEQPSAPPPPAKTEAEAQTQAKDNAPVAEEQATKPEAQAPPPPPVKPEAKKTAAEPEPSKLSQRDPEAFTDRLYDEIYLAKSVAYLKAVITDNQSEIDMLPKQLHVPLMKKYEEALAQMEGTQK